MVDAGPRLTLCSQASPYPESTLSRPSSSSTNTKPTSSLFRLPIPVIRRTLAPRAQRRHARNKGWIERCWRSCGGLLRGNSRRRHPRLQLRLHRVRGGSLYLEHSMVTSEACEFAPSCRKPYLLISSCRLNTLTTPARSRAGPSRPAPLPGSTPRFPAIPGVFGTANFATPTRPAGNVSARSALGAGDAVFGSSPGSALLNETTYVRPPHDTAHELIPRADPVTRRAVPFPPVPVQTSFWRH